MKMLRLNKISTIKKGTTEIGHLLWKVMNLIILESVSI